MNIAAWRTIVIEQPSELSYTQGTLEINQPDFRMQIPLFDVQSILIVSLRTRITSYLINELCKRQISVFFAMNHQSQAGNSSVIAVRRAFQIDCGSKYNGKNKPARKSGTVS